MKIDLNELKENSKTFYLNRETEITIKYDQNTNSINIEESDNYDYNLLKKIHSYKNKNAFFFDLLKETTPITKERNEKILKTVPSVTEEDRQNEYFRGKTLEHEFSKRQKVYNNKYMELFPYEIKEQLMEEYKLASDKQLQKIYKYTPNMNEEEKKYIANKLKIWDINK